MHDPEYCGNLSMEGLYDLLMTVGYDRAEAKRIALKRGWNRLSAGLTA